MNSTDDLMKNLLKGDFRHLPQDRSQTVRIFLSSTFTDTHEERDYLIENIFPKLRQYCKKEYGLDFQIIDMRWGIPHEATNNHSTTTICINEVKNCQKLSIGPNFISLISHRYGTRLLPTRILANEFDIFKQEINDSKDEYSELIKYENDTLKIDDILNYCYKKDENEIPNRYRLLNINSLISDYNIQEKSLSLWDELQLRLSYLFRKVADACFKKGKITLEQKTRFFVSVTEKEVYNGILQAKNVTDNVLVFFRDIDDLETQESINKDKKLAARFVDLDKDGNIDVESKELLNDLKKRICEKLPDSNIHRFSGLKWNPEGGITRKNHSEYMKQFGDVFYDSVKRLIDINAKKPNFIESISPNIRYLVKEVLDHAKFSIECVEKFHGRVDLLESIKNYILSDNRKALYIYGESGCGKTSVIAKVANEISNIVPDPDNWISILRFMGTTPGTSNILGIIRQILVQLSYLYNTRFPLMSFLRSSGDVKHIFLNCLENLRLKENNKKLVLFLDSIDQLSVGDYSLDWLIHELPDNVKIIYSTLPNHGDILNRIEKLEKDEKHLVKVEQLNSSIVKTIIEDWLSKKKRQLSEKQWEILENLFKDAVLYPLYVKLIFDVIVKWESYYEPDDSFNRNLSIDKCIQYLFKLFEKEHGSVLFSRLMCYMTSFKNGISESELEDIMSIDDDVLFEVFEFHEPPVRRFPVALWARIKNDLREYMVEKETDETKVIYWYHRRFIEVANSFYISKMNSSQREIVFGNVVDYFNETWKNKPKPYKYNDYLKKKKKLDTDEAQAIRDTATQKTVLIAEDGTIRYNKRKLSELPNFICNLTANLAIPLYCEHVAFNYDFFRGQIQFLNYSDIFEASEKISSGSSYNLSEENKNSLSELTIIKFVYLQCLFSIIDFPSSCALQLLSRLLVFYGHTKYITNFIQQCDEISYKHCALVAPYQNLPEVGSGELFSLEKHSKGIKYTCIGGDNDAFVFTLSDKIHCFNLSSLKTPGEFSLPTLSHLNDEYKEFIIHFNQIETDDSVMLKDIKGFIIVSSEHSLSSIDLTGSFNFTKTFENLRVNQIIQITSTSFIVSFTGENFIEIYDIKLAIPLQKKIFDQSLKFIIHSLDNKRVHFDTDFSKDILLAFCLGQSEIQVINLNLNTSDNSFSFELRFKIPSSGRECLSGLMIDGLFLSAYSDGSICFFRSSDTNDFDLTIYKATVTRNRRFKILDRITVIQQDLKTNDLILLLGDDLNLYIQNHETVCKIIGPYQDGKLSKNNDDKLFAINMGIVDIYKLFSKDKTFSAVRLNQINVHFNLITFMFIKDDMLLTTSLDSSIKVSFISRSTPLDQQLTNFKTTSYDIKYFFEVESNRVGTYSKNNGTIDLWNLENGKVIGSIETKFEFIFNIAYNNGICFIVGIENDIKSKNVSFKAYQKGKEPYSSILNECVSAKVTYNKKREIFIITTKTIKSTLQVYLVDYKNGWNMELIEPSGVEPSEKILDHICITHQNMLLFVFQGNEFIFIDTNKNEIVSRKDLFDDQRIPALKGLELSLIQSIENSDDIIALNRLKQLVYISKEGEIMMSTDDKYKFTKLISNGSTICVLNEVNNQVLAYELQQLKKNGSLDNSIFRIELKTTVLSHFSMNSNYLVIIESPKLLSVYQLNDGKKVASFPQYCEAKSLHVSEEYVALGMANRRVISYLIVNENNYGKVKQLESRQIENIDQSTKTKVKKLLVNLNNMMDASSDEDVYDNDEIFGEEELNDANEDEDEGERVKKIKNLRKQVKRIPLNELDKLTFTNKDLNENWLVDKLKSDDSNLSNQIQEENIDMTTKIIENEKDKEEKISEDLVQNNKTAQACLLM